MLRVSSLGNFLVHNAKAVKVLNHHSMSLSNSPTFRRFSVSLQKLTPFESLKPMPRVLRISCKGFSTNNKISDTIKLKAIEGDIESMTELGRQYFDNERIEVKDKIIGRQLAREWLLKAAKKDSSVAQYYLSLLLFKSDVVSEVTIDHSASKSSTKEEVLKEIKDQRIANAKGKKLKKKLTSISDDDSTDDISATSTENNHESDPHYWLQLSAANNNPYALCYLGNLHMERYNAYLDSGAVVPTTTASLSDNTSKKCGGNCQCSGSGGGCGGNCSCSSPTSPSDTPSLDVYAAIDCYMKAGALGSAEALFNLGSIYFDGVESVPYESTSCGGGASKTEQEVAEKKKKSNQSSGTSDEEHVHDEHCGHIHHQEEASSPFDVVITKTDSKGHSTTTGSSDGIIGEEQLILPSSSESNAEKEEEEESFPQLIDIDMPKSLEYFSRAAALGDTAAQFWCGYCYNLGVNGTNLIDPLRAVNYFKSAAQKGHVEAHYYLANIYRSGLSSGVNPDSPPVTTGGDGSDVRITVEANVEQFLYHLNTACEQNHNESLFTMADLFMNGLTSSNFNTTTTNSPEVISDDLSRTTGDNKSLAEKSLESKLHSLSPLDEETYIPRDVFKAMEFYQRASDRGHNASTVCLGVIHYNGVLATVSNPSSLPADKRRAFELYNIAAESGSKEAWRNLASMYYLGDGVPKSEETAKQIMNVIFKVKRKDE